MTTAAAAEAAGERRARYVEGGCIAHPARVGERADMEDEGGPTCGAHRAYIHTARRHTHWTPSVRKPPENRLPCMQPSQEEQPRAAGAWPSASGRSHKARRVLCELLSHSRAQVLCIRCLCVSALFLSRPPRAWTGDSLSMIVAGPNGAAAVINVCVCCSLHAGCSKSLKSIAGAPSVAQKRKMIYFGFCYTQ